MCFVFFFVFFFSFCLLLYHWNNNIFFSVAHLLNAVLNIFAVLTANFTLKKTTLHTKLKRNIYDGICGLVTVGVTNRVKQESSLAVFCNYSAITVLAESPVCTVSDWHQSKTLKKWCAVLQYKAHTLANSSKLQRQKSELQLVASLVNWQIEVCSGGLVWFDFYFWQLPSITRVKCPQQIFIWLSLLFHWLVFLMASFYLHWQPVAEPGWRINFIAQMYHGLFFNS